MLRKHSLTPGVSPGHTKTTQKYNIDDGDLGSRDKCTDVISILPLSALLTPVQSSINIAADHRFHLGPPDYEICI